MGCWNATCFLTRLPILYHEPVKLVLVAQREPDRQNANHADGVYAPVALPLDGLYDDYGGIEDITAPELAFRSWAALDLYRFEDGRPVNISPRPTCPGQLIQTLPELIRMAGSGKLYYKDQNGGRKAAYLPVRAQLCKIKYWNKLVKIYGGRIREEYLRSVTFRLSLLGPLRQAARALDEIIAQCVTDALPYRLDLAAAAELAAVTAGMDDMRASYAPVPGGGSQDSLDQPWQRDWYRSMWLDAEAMSQRFQEDPPGPIHITLDYDGGRELRLRTDRTGEQAVLFTAGLDPDQLYHKLLDDMTGFVLKQLSSKK